MSLPDLGCACANIRRAARLVTQVYSREMGDAMEPSQFSLLSALSRLPGARQAVLGEILGLDKTSLSRNLKVMRQKGWIEQSASKDLRERGYRLTDSGAHMLESTRPHWRRAQDKLHASLTAEQWASVQVALSAVTEAARRIAS